MNLDMECLESLMGDAFQNGMPHVPPLVCSTYCTEPMSLGTTHMTFSLPVGAGRGGEGSVGNFRISLNIDTKQPSQMRWLLKLRMIYFVTVIRGDV